MKRIFIIVLAMMMLLSCVACSDMNNNDAETGNSTPLAGSKHPLTAETPMEQRPLLGDFQSSSKNHFDRYDPRKKYLEEKYGVTAYLGYEKTQSRMYTTFYLEGYEGTFKLYDKEDLIAAGTPEELITADYMDDAYFTVAYVEIYEYFAQAIKESGVTVDRLIIDPMGGKSPYDPNKPFADQLPSVRDSDKAFSIGIYGDFSQNNDAVDRLLMALEKLDFVGKVVIRQVLQDISNVNNTDLANDTPLASVICLRVNIANSLELNK